MDEKPAIHAFDGDLFAPVVYNPQDMPSFRENLALVLAKRMVHATEMHFAKVIGGPAEVEVTVVGLNPADFYVDLPESLRAWAFKPVGTDPIPTEHYAGSQIIGVPVVYPIDGIRGFQWVKDEDESYYLEHMINGEAH
jgi:hypothetical protein